MAAAVPRTSLRARWALLLLVLGYLALALVAGVTPSPIAPPSPKGLAGDAGFASWAVRGARLLRFDRLGRSAQTVLAIALLAVLLALFAILAVEAWRGRVRVGPAVATAALGLILAASAPLMLSRDVYSYAAYGRMVALHGANPYRDRPSSFPGDPFTPVLSQEWIDTPSVYGPGFTLVSAGIASIARGSPAATVLSFKLLAGLSAFVATLLAVLACRLIRPARAALAAVAVGLNPVVVVYAVGGGHNDALVMAVLTSGLCLALLSLRDPTGTEGPAGWAAVGATALLTLAGLLKLPAAIPLMVWICSLVRSAPASQRLWRGVLHVGLAVSVAAVVSAPLFAGARTVNLGTLSNVEGWASGARLVGRGAEALGRAAVGSTLATGARRAVIAAFLIAFAVAWWRILRRARPEGSADAWGSSLLLFALASPYLLPWYAAWFLPFLPLLADAGLTWIGLAAAGLLAVTGVPAEPAFDPGLWRGMILAVHYVVAPGMLALFVAAMSRVFRTPSDRDGLTISPPLAAGQPA